MPGGIKWSPRLFTFAANVKQNGQKMRLNSQRSVPFAGVQKFIKAVIINGMQKKPKQSAMGL